MPNFPIHPAAELFPMMSDIEFASLKDDIAKNGLREPITLCDAKVLDGRNRLRACDELGIEPKFTSYNGDSPTAFVWSLNGERRNLTKSQRAAVAAEMLPHLETEAKARQQLSEGRGQKGTPIPADLKGESAELAGRRVGVGKEMVRKAKHVKASDPDLHEKVKRGEVLLEDAHRKVKSGKELPPKPQKLPLHKRIEQIRQLAADGNRADQIAEIIGFTGSRAHETVRGIAKKAGIELPDAAIGRTHKINARRVIETTVHGLEGYAQGLQTINGGIVGIDRTVAKNWATSLRSSIGIISSLRKQLERHANGN